MFAAAFAEPLPVGNTGIAARYPSDVGIGSDSDVLFADDFESYSSASDLTSSGNYDSYYNSPNIAIDSSEVFQGSQSLRVRMPSGGASFNAVIRSLPDQDTLYVRVYARYQSGYQGINSAHNGLRISGRYSGPGVRPDGTDFFLVEIEDSRYMGEGEPGFTNAYLYHPEMDDVYGEHWYPDGTVTNGVQSFGPNFIARTNVIPRRGDWICYEALVQMNTPGTRDGRVAVWQDGILIAEWLNVRFRDVGTVKIDEIQLENGGQGSSQQNDKWYDNLVIAKKYIGPMAMSTPARPNPPADLKTSN
jgi:hypothetical protein